MRRHREGPSRSLADLIRRPRWIRTGRDTRGRAAVGLLGAAIIFGAGWWVKHLAVRLVDRLPGPVTGVALGAALVVWLVVGLRRRGRRPPRSPIFRREVAMVAVRDAARGLRRRNDGGGGAGFHAGDRLVTVEGRYGTYSAALCPGVAMVDWLDGSEQSEVLTDEMSSAPDEEFLRARDRLAPVD